MGLAFAFALIGIMPGVWLMNQFDERVIAGAPDPVMFTATTMIGMIALAGIVVRNSLILGEFITQARSDGLALKEALIQAGAVREGLALSLVLEQILEVEIPSLQRTLPAQVEELVPANHESLILIPVDRVSQYGQLDVVWVQSDDHIDRRFIRRGRELQGGMLEVISGLEEGELLAPPQ